MKQGEGKLTIVSYNEDGIREEQVYVGSFLDDQFHGNENIKSKLIILAVFQRLWYADKNKWCIL